MSASSPHHNPAAEEQAALWAARLEGSSLAPADRAALDAWLAEDPAHRDLLAQYRRFSSELEDRLLLLAAAGGVALPAAPAARHGWQFGWILGPALAAAALAVGVVWWARPAHQSASFATAAAQRREIALVDGTRVELDAGTRLDVEIGGAERHVRLSVGEAFFTVSKDPNRPFIVETPAGSVRVTGTVFSVHTEPSVGLDVTVVEGSVLVRPGIPGAPAAEPVSLHANDAVSIGPDGAVVKRTLSNDALDEALLWRKGKVVFHTVPLRTALARIAHYAGREIHVSDDAANLPVGGLYGLDPDEFFKAFEALQPIRVTSTPGGPVQVTLAAER
ncbi:MAG TPA: FecR domain-containing protein [Opitutaceae bacterium]|nr:FecR domain-containing protein [Opitutaceae bacterium]